MEALDFRENILGLGFHFKVCKVAVCMVFDAHFVLHDIEPMQYSCQLIFGEQTNKIKGRIKEAVGALTDNDNLKRQGQRDQTVGEVKEAAESAAEKVKDKVERAVEKV